MIGIGVIGFGYWGPNLVRNFSGVPDAQVVAVADLKQDRLRQVQARYPGVSVSPDYDSLLTDPRIDAIAIATPVSSHFELASRALSAGKHVFVEKPLTETVEEAERLISQAQERELILHVDHTFVYSGAVKKIKELVACGEIGNLYYYDSVRVNLGLFQPDVSVIADLAVHDLSIMDHVFGASPVAVSAAGVSHVPDKPANIAFVTLFLEDNAVAHLHVNWLAPVKVRRTLIGGSRKMIVYDDLEPSEKVKVYDKGISINGDKDDLYRALIDYRAGDMWAPQVEIAEALQTEARHFIDCVLEGKQSSTDGSAGLRVVRIVEAATRSMSQYGRPVQLDAIR